MSSGVYKRTDKTRENLKLSHIGQKVSEKTKEKIRELKKGNKNVLGKHWKIKDISKKMGENNPMYGKRKENSTNWQGGKSFELYPYDWRDDLKNVIRKRDNYICQECGIHQNELNNGQIKKLDIHHKDYNKNNLDPQNLISLCRSCHIKTNYNREYWGKCLKVGKIIIN